MENDKHNDDLDMTIDEILNSVKNGKVNRKDTDDSYIAPPVKHYNNTDHNIVSDSKEDNMDSENIEENIATEEQQNEELSTPIDVDDENSKKVKPKKEHVKNKKGLNTAAKIVIVIVVIIVALGAAFGIVAAATNDNPFYYISAAITNSPKKLLANWESDTSPGLSAYVFNEDGTYESYIANYSFTGAYEVTINKLTLINTLTEKEDVYKYRILGNSLYLTKIEENGIEVEDEEETSKYNKVDQLNQRTLADIVDSIKSEAAK